MLMGCEKLNMKFINVFVNLLAPEIFILILAHLYIKCEYCINQIR